MAVPLQFFNCARSNPRFNGDFGTLASSLDSGDLGAAAGRNRNQHRPSNSPAPRDWRSGGCAEPPIQDAP